MPARAMWKAELNLDKVRVPVKLYAAVQDTAIHFRLLHAKDSTPVKQRMVDPETDQPVPPEEIQRAIEIDRGLFVLLTKEEQAALEPKPSREITVSRLVPADEIDERWFDRPYYLGPDGDDERYFAIAEVLEAREWFGVAHWVMRKKRYVGALHGSNGYLLLETLRHAEEIVEVGAVRPATSRAPDPRELKLAEQLIATLEDKFDPSEWHDQYREQVLAMLEAKAQGKVVTFPRAAKRAQQASLVADLQASLKAGRRAAGGR